MKKFITIGTFDGVHLGHQQMLSALVREAGEVGLQSLVAYFPVPPKAVLSGKTAQTLLTLPDERQRLLFSCGVDHALPLEFTRTLARMSPEDFFRSVIVGKLHAGGILAGQDFAFGHNRDGHISWLRARCAREAIVLAVPPFVKAGGHKISSSGLRALLHGGDVACAAALMGRNYCVRGTVIRGEGLGRKLGFPTANLDAGPLKLLPRGVFAVRARAAGGEYRGVANVGLRPTVCARRAGLPLCEVHLLDFSGDIYGQQLEVEFAAFLRGEAKFNGLGELTAAIRADIAAVRQKTVFSVQ